MILTFLQYVLFGPGVEGVDMYIGYVYCAPNNLLMNTAIDKLAFVAMVLREIMKYIIIHVYC